MRKGFTLIELMIVVAIIAIIAAIAIPSLMRSRMAANETAAAAALKAYAEAQEIYHRTDYDADGVLEYSTVASGANSLLEKVANSADLSLIDRTFASAFGVATAVVPKAGYVFTLQTCHGVAGASPWTTGATLNLTLGYGACANPQQYDSTGRNAFMISNAGTIYQSDLGTDNTQYTFFDPTTATPKWIPAE